MEKKYTITFLKPAMLLAMFALCFIVCIAIRPSVANAASKKVKITLEFTDGTQKTWKTGDKKISLGKKKLAYVYFGSYPQSEVTGDARTSKIALAKYDKNGVATVDGVKYKGFSYHGTVQYANVFDIYDKAYAYFKFEPIKWRVLSNKNGKLLLLSEYGLDELVYNGSWTDITWAESALRDWLNTYFYSIAFTNAEKKLIKTTTLKNDEFGLLGGENTKDKIFLLSISDITNKKYGFSENLDKQDVNRCCETTEYEKATGNNESSAWWLRSPGYNSLSANIVDEDGTVRDDWVPFFLIVRPAIQLNLSSVIK